MIAFLLSVLALSSGVLMATALLWADNRRRKAKTFDGGCGPYVCWLCGREYWLGTAHRCEVVTKAYEVRGLVRPGDVEPWRPDPSLVWRPDAPPKIEGGE